MELFGRTGKSRVRGLNSEQLQTLETLAACQFSIEQMAILLEVETGRLEALIAKRDSETAKAFDKGRLTAEMEVRTAIFQAAKNGSTPAQKLYVDFMDDTDFMVSDLRGKNEE